MSKNTTKLIPPLRFPEFVNEGEWVEDTLINIAKFRRGSFPQPYGLPEWYDDKNGMPFIQVYDVSDDFRLKPKTKSKISKLAAEQSVFIPKGTVIITIQGSIGRVAITQYNAYIDRTLLLFEEYYNEIDKTFFAYVIFMLFEIEKEKAPGGIIKTITKEVLSDFKINIPKLHEQKKIASCLSSLDEVIAAHSQKLEALKDHKKGLMQNLFPQEGEKEPKLKFSDDNSWKEVCMPNMVYFQEGPGIMAVDFRNEGVPLVRLSGIGGSTVSLKGCNFLDPDMVETKWNHFRLSKNDLVISTSATFGLTSIVDEVADGSVFYTGLIRFKPLNDKIDLQYLKTFLGCPLFERQAESAAVGGGIKHFGPTHLKQMTITLPSVQEQQKIAYCLSSLDALITAQTEKIEQLKLHKKGLMQGLFPKIES